MTQAVNLANFANYLDSSGGMSPSAINAPVPVTKGGTASTTAPDARTALGVDYTTIYQNIRDLIYPIGSVYINASDNTNPATLLGFGTWVTVGDGRVLTNQNTSDASFSTLGGTGGSKDAVVVSHNHTASSSSSFSGNPLGSHSHTASITNVDNNNPGGTYGVPALAIAPGSSGFGTNSVSAGTPSGTVSTSTSIGTTGVSGTNANLVPYVVVKIWKRTA